MPISANGLEKLAHINWEYNDGRFDYFVRTYSDDEIEKYKDSEEPVEKGLYVYTTCNDLFYWGCSDCEEITDNDLDFLTQCFKDLLDINKISGSIYAHELYASRKREMRPQGAMFKHIPVEFYEIFKATGPERETGFGNPHPIPNKGSLV